ncbi:MAG: hypothetical protein COV52_09915 [Gammaproteobacteria bacterium CG11_big_fil_rev_8_21_14_0_20_46_22]|nr:MAG: hypothetical protein COW05_05080 [Gammaproteobacteria bacterium CG12_big_fil_rev_8_21_14_0_65_46_12]PIR10138.1 MAG: hypothetical protein COV52_09915 [Gammaproteobacteria bacterium CG11_big_fil_rev_8_21_14_0_20_46_22]
MASKVYLFSCNALRSLATSERLKFSALATNSSLAPNLLVLTGHTHHAAEHQAAKNFIIKVGQTEYCQPKIEFIELT